jgi:hypothetical protein
MNRTLLTCFMLAFLSALVTGQERTEAVLDRTSGPPAGDRNSVRADTVKTDGIPEYVPLWETDTLVLGSDSAVRLRHAPRVKGDTARFEPDFSHSASRAIMFALVLPGLGQAYNRKFFKMPIVWAAFGGAGYAISYNSRQYRLASEDYAQTPDDTNERYLRFWRRNMELSYIAAMAVYALQVVDAYVDAQLYNWDVNEDLSMRVVPSLQPLMAPGGVTGQVYGLTCCFQLKAH